MKCSAKNEKLFEACPCVAALNGVVFCDILCAGCEAARQRRYLGVSDVPRDSEAGIHGHEQQVCLSPPAREREKLFFVKMLFSSFPREVQAPKTPSHSRAIVFNEDVSAVPPRSAFTQLLSLLCEQPS